MNNKFYQYGSCNFYCKTPYVVIFVSNAIIECIELRSHNVLDGYKTKKGARGEIIIEFKEISEGEFMKVFEKVYDLIGLSYRTALGV